MDGLGITNSTTGTSTFTVASDAILNITNLVAGNERDGIDVNAAGGGNISLVHAGQGAISVSGGNGVWLKAVQTGSIAAKIGSGVTINVDNTGPGSSGNHAGVQARALGTGSIQIDNSAAIQSIGTNGHGIYTDSRGGSTSVRNAGAIGTSGLNGFGLRSVVTNGDLTIANTGSITTTGPNGHGIYATSNIGATDRVSVENLGAISVGLPNATQGSRGIYIIGRSNSDVYVSGSGKISVDGNASSDRSAGIIISADAGNISVDYSGDLAVKGHGAGGIRADSTGGNVDVRYTGSRIETFHSNANGIYASTGSSTGKVNISAGGTIVTHSDAGGGAGTGMGSFGVQGIALGNDVNIVFNGPLIDVNGSGAAILAGTAYLGGTGVGQTTVTNSGQLLARGDNQQGIRTYTATGAQTILNSGPIQTLGATGSSGIQALATGAARIGIDNRGDVTTKGTDSSGIEARTLAGTVEVSNAALIQAGWGSSAGILTGGTSQKFVNTGAITALSDVAFRGDSDGSSGDVRVTNNGAMIGSISAATSMVSIENAGTWTLRNYVDTDGDGVRDRWGLATNSLSSATGNKISNAGTLVLAAQTSTGGTFESTGAYLPFGNVANTPMQGGAVQGQLLGVKTFDNSGTIDVAGNSSAVGNVLVISGGQKAGEDGGGVFVTNGGVVKLNSVLDDGVNSRSDVLVVDSIQKGASPTGLRINNVGGQGAFTPGHGIAVVEVMNKSNAAGAAGAFVLDGRAVAGAYEYQLHQGARDGTGTDAWYLRSERPDPTPPPDPPPDPPSPNPEPLYRPEVAVYLANQRLAGQMFVHSMHDRLGEPQYTEAERTGLVDEKRRSMWLRMTGKWENSRSANGVYKVSSDVQLIQGGGDIAQWRITGDSDRLHLGGMLSYGTAHSSGRADQNPYSATGKTEGYMAGLYATWFQNDKDRLGAYIDTWFQYGWFRNRVDGQYLESVKYDAQGWAASAEVGYAVPLVHEWVLEPQAQLIYIDYDPDGVTEPNGTQVLRARSNGTVTRLGLRGHRTFELKNGRQIQPFVTVNWWHTDTESSMHFNTLPQGSLYPKDRYELKVGAHANFTKGWTGWVNVAGSWGGQDYEQYAGRIGVKYTW